MNFPRLHRKNPHGLCGGGGGGGGGSSGKAGLFGAVLRGAGLGVGMGGGRAPALKHSAASRPARNSGSARPALLPPCRPGGAAARERSRKASGPDTAYGPVPRAGARQKQTEKHAAFEHQPIDRNSEQREGTSAGSEVARSLTTKHSEAMEHEQTSAPASWAEDVETQDPDPRPAEAPPDHAA
ncbi:AT-rich interactive domain-containing protein 1B-like [Schistocerca piceifrons]|uniref:AT-rich interactive domain-containing protein 1B-like n=1 Tax=Schistocerca piceifrons TaxID=274613 RepID=UPI001F5E905C|nr:AT-rich interactive domain-containing protein 1B-like [Schistocerca piceifrons]